VSRHIAIVVARTPATGTHPSCSRPSGTPPVQTRHFHDTHYPTTAIRYSQVPRGLFLPLPGFQPQHARQLFIRFFLTSHATPAYSFLQGLWCLPLALDGVSLRFRFIRYKLTSLNILFFHKKCLPSKVVSAWLSNSRVPSLKLVDWPEIFRSLIEQFNLVLCMLERGPLRK
jgi:hypothetical protein